MKLAEALSLRKDLETRISKLKKLLETTVKVQEGDVPTENPEGVILALEDPCWQIRILPFTHTLSYPGITYTFRHMCCQSHHLHGSCTWIGR